MNSFPSQIDLSPDLKPTVMWLTLDYSRILQVMNSIYIFGIKVDEVVKYQTGDQFNTRPRSKVS